VKRVSALLLVLVVAAGCGSGSASQGTTPDTGSIWFGQTYDLQTLSVTGMATTFTEGSPIALLGHLNRTTGDEVLGLLILGSGELGTTGLGAFPADDTYIGHMIEPLDLSTTGTFTVAIVDSNGNHLADGSLTVNPAASGT
jgi:hypothetical protein